MNELERAERSAFGCVTSTNPSARQFGSDKGYGHIIDPLAHRATSFRILRPKLGLVSLPKKVNFRDLIDKYLGIHNQINTSMCTGFANGGSAAASMAFQETPIEIPSFESNYKFSRCIDRFPADQGIIGNLPPLVDEGAEPNQNVRALAEWGLPPRTVWGETLTLEDGSVVPDASLVNAELTVRQAETASAFEFQGAYKILTVNDARAYEIMSAVANGLFPPFAWEVDSAAEAYTGGVLGPSDPNDILGGHDCYLCGYEWNGSDPRTLVVDFANSWSRKWGENGYGLANRAFLDRAVDLYAMKVRKKVPS